MDTGFLAKILMKFQWDPLSMGAEYTWGKKSVIFDK